MPRAGAWRASLRRALRDQASVPPPPGSTPVVLCSWLRPHAIEPLLADIVAQEDVRPFVVLWNNHPGFRLDVDAATRRARRDGLDLHVVHSQVNLGGIARFVVGRRLHRAGWRGPVVMIDDDMRLGPAFLRELRAAWSPLTYAGVWAWRIGERGYWDRERAAPGTEADYVGTGGSIVVAELLDDDDLFDWLPDRYGGIEDLWLSRWVSARGGRTVAAAASHVLGDDHLGQGHDLHARKDELWHEVDDLVRHRTAMPGPVTLRQPSRREVVALLARGAARRVGIGRFVLRMRRVLSR